MKEQNKTTKEIKELIRELTKKINKWNYSYYILNNSEVSDQEYDENIEKLSYLEKKYNFFFENSPTKKTISKDCFSTEVKKIKREVPMLSLKGVFEYDSITKFDKNIKKKIKTTENIEYVCEWKIDGLSAAIIYISNKKSIPTFFSFSTRGDGLEGEDISSNKDMVKDLPLNIPAEFDNCEIRGEIYMKKKELEIIKNKEQTKSNKFLNARNVAAGSIRNLSNKNRNLNFFAYNVTWGEKNNNKEFLEKKMSTQSKILDELKKIGFSVNQNYKLISGIKEVINYIKSCEKKIKELEFESDGIVIKINERKYWKLLGENNKYPRWAIAYKFSKPSKATYIKSINCSVSKNGRISYVAELNPINIENSLVSNVTLHNYNFIREKKLNIGDEIMIKKSGSVIPQITEKIISINNKETFWTPPTNCPSCDNILIWNKNNLYQICANENCKERTINYLSNFASKEALDIKWISRALIEKFYDNNLLKDPTDLFKLSEKKIAILKLDGFKLKLTERILASIEETKKRPFYRILTALSIPDFSLQKAKKLTNKYKKEEILKLIEEKKWEAIEELLGKGTKKGFELFFSKNKNEKLLRELNNICS